MSGFTNIGFKGNVALNTQITETPIASYSLTQQANNSAPAVVSGNNLGSSVSCNNDNIIIGCPNYTVNGTANAGSAFIYNKTNSTLTMFTSLNPQQNGYFGSSVAISTTSFVVGAPGENNGQGNAYFGTGYNGNWGLDSQLVFDTSVEKTGKFGSSVDISETYIICGAPYAKAKFGAVYVYDTSLTYKAKLSATTINFGWDVSLDSETLAISTPYENASTGAVYIFSHNSSNKWIQTAKLTNINGQSNDHYGYSIDIHAGKLLIGSPGSNETFFYNGYWDTWTLLNTITVRTTNGLYSDLTYNDADLQGYCVCQDKLIYISSPNNNGQGCIYAFELVDGNIIPSINTKLISTTGSAGENFGTSISSYSSELVIGNPNANSWFIFN